MATEVQIPKLGLTMQEGTITQWEVEPGTVVAEGDVLFSMETDKVETTVESPAGGRFHPTADVGETFECGVVVGWVLADGEDLPEGVSAPAPDAGGAAEAAPAAAPAAAAPVAAAPASTNGRLLASPNARRVAVELGIDLAAISGSGPGGRIVSEDVEAAAAAGTAPVAAPAPAAAAAPVAAPPASGAPVSPLVRRLADELGVDVSTLTGTGVGGRITRADVQRAGGSAPAAAPAAPAAAAAATAPAPGPVRAPGDRIPLAGMRKVIAERMHTSLQEMAQLTLTMDVDMDRAVELRERLKADWGEAGMPVPGYTDLIVKAAGLALRAHPNVNAMVHDTEIELLTEVNVGMAVSVPDGLMVPVIRAVDELPLDALAAESSRLAAAARDGKLTLPELEGGTFSVSALGMFGIDAFTPVVNPPNVAILGVGRIRDDTAWDGDTPQRVRRMTLSLTIDHRAVDGAPGAEFLQTMKGILERPMRLLAAG
ncbi:MAG: dihydrolipoamide acetyltransferase family protein [Actinomycetota bacterium]